MPKDIVITTQEQFSEWLSEQHWFIEQYMSHLEPPPTLIDLNQQPSSIITFRLCTLSGWCGWAGEQKTVRSFSLECRGVKQWSCTSEYDYTSREYIYSEEFSTDIDAEGKIGLLIDRDIQLICNEIVVRDLGDIPVIVAPTLSHREMVIKVSGEHFPEPKQWIKLFADASCEVAWRRYGEPTIVPASKVPMEDYSGWFLQEPKRFSQTYGGLFFLGCANQDYGFRAVLQLNDDGVSKNPLWQATGKVMKTFPKITVECGNCKFTGQEWFECVESEDPHQYVMSRFVPPGTSKSDLI